MNSFSYHTFTCCPLVLWLACLAQVTSLNTLLYGQEDNPADPLEDDREAWAALDGVPALGRWIALAGENTRDLYGTPQQTEWKQLKGPGLGLSAEEAAQERVWIFLREPGEYLFTFNARYENVWLKPGKIAFKLEPGSPVLPFEEAFGRIGAGEAVTLPGEGWTQIAGSRVVLKPDRQGDGLEFRPYRPGFYLFEAKRRNNLKERRAIEVPTGKEPNEGNRRPRCVLVPPKNGIVGSPVLLDMRGSSDMDQDLLHAVWESPDEIRGVRIERTGPLTAHFLVEKEGVYQLRYAVSDGKLQSAFQDAYITFEPIQAGEVDATDLLAELPTETDPLNRPATLLLYESNLDRAVQIFPPRTEIALRIDRRFADPARFAEIPLNLGVQNGPIRVALDWIGLQSRTCYFRESERSIWLNAPGLWDPREPLKNVVMAADALYEKPDGSDLLLLLQATFAGVLRSLSNASLSIEPNTQRLIAVMPEQACERLKQIVASLRSPALLGLPELPAPTVGERLMRQRLAEARVTIRTSGQRMDLILRHELSEKTGVPVGFDPTHFSEGLPRIALNLQQARLREAVREIVRQAGLTGCQIHPFGGLWFYKGDAPYPLSESLRESALVRTYDLTSLLERNRLLNGDIVVHQIKRRVYPASWKDPDVACFYHALTRKLVIVHGEFAQVQALRFLKDLNERGEAALGPTLGE